MKNFWNKSDPKKVIFLYEHVQAWKASGITLGKYSQLHNIDKKILNNACSRILCIKLKKDKQEYQRLCALGRAYMESDMRRKDFCETHNISKPQLLQIVNHLGYEDIISEYLREKKGMKFIEVKHRSAEVAIDKVAEEEPKSAPIAEVMPSQNDVEISITQGVKVCISPNVDSMKIIKIIELLKDL